MTANINTVKVLKDAKGVSSMPQVLKSARSEGRAGLRTGLGGKVFEQASQLGGLTL